MQKATQTKNGAAEYAHKVKLIVDRVRVAQMPPDNHLEKVHVAKWTEGVLARGIWFVSDDSVHQNFNQPLVVET
jgi:hypothetical protein